MSGLHLNVTVSIAADIFQMQLSVCIAAFSFTALIGDSKCRSRILNFVAALLHRRRIEGREICRNTFVQR